jgi:hypothetical protein
LRDEERQREARISVGDVVEMAIEPLWSATAKRRKSPRPRRAPSRKRSS